MSIDQLNKAATAAGFAMATPDDTDASQQNVAVERPEPETRALALAPQQPELKPAPDAFSAMGTWLKGFVPGFAGRLPA